VKAVGLKGGDQGKGNQDATKQEKSTNEGPGAHLVGNGGKKGKRGGRLGNVRRKESSRKEGEKNCALLGGDR